MGKESEFPIFTLGSWCNAESFGQFGLGVESRLTGPPLQSSTMVSFPATDDNRPSDTSDASRSAVARTLAFQLDLRTSFAATAANRCGQCLVSGHFDSPATRTHRRDNKKIQRTPPVHWNDALPAYRSRGRKDPFTFPSWYPVTGNRRSNVSCVAS